MLACDCLLILIKLPWTSVTVKYDSSHRNAHPSECKKMSLQPTVCLFSHALSSSLLCFSSRMSHSFPLSETSWCTSCAPGLWVAEKLACTSVLQRSGEYYCVCLATMCRCGKSWTRRNRVGHRLLRKSASLIRFCLWPEMMIYSVPICLSQELLMQNTAV